MGSAILSDRIQRVAPSLTLAITSKAKALKAAGEDVIGFGAGEPDFDTPEPVKEAAMQAIRDGHTRYTAVDGIPELKAAIQARFELDHGLQYDLSQIAVSCGAKQSIYNILQVCVNPGDDVIIPAPYWVSYPDQVRLAGGNPVIVQTDVSNGFCVTADQIEAAITDNSRILILNSPGNPTGAALNRTTLQEIGEVAAKHDLLIISDEIYEKLVYDSFGQSSIATLSDELYERTIVVNGVSKAYAMTGWRIGYIAGPTAIVRATAKLQGQCTSNPASVAQYAAVAALKLPDAVVEEMRQKFEQRRNIMVDLLNQIEGVNCPCPTGAFYVFPDISSAIAQKWPDAVAFADALIEDQKVAVVPGDGFGAPGHIRLSYACSELEIEEGVRRIAEFLS